MDPEQDIVGTEAAKKADEERANFKPIKLEDTGFFPAFALSQKPRSQVIKWQQDLNDREESYTLVVFEYTGNSEDKTPCHARLFISDSAMAQFQATLQPVVNPSSSTPWHAFTVTNDFQYGQLNEAGEARFLVYHKKESKPYQHRFVNSRWVKAGNLTCELLHKSGFGSPAGLDFLDEQGRNYFGDFLHNFDGQVVEANVDVMDIISEIFE